MNNFYAIQCNYPVINEENGNLCEIKSLVAQTFLQYN